MSLRSLGAVYCPEAFYISDAANCSKALDVSDAACCSEALGFFSDADRSESLYSRGAVYRDEASCVRDVAYCSEALFLLRSEALNSLDGVFGTEAHSLGAFDSAGRAETFDSLGYADFDETADPHDF
ncbi:unnamed protein product [Prorocentrum cordatum]|uniref:Uncharacterized protein n=1 Tax=Prorocentrum cordatum TaxID=2364126 RepID=A0ABN9VEP8_9DINO|nr:unnamed protein product [Polarella glacialis]